MPAFPPPHHQPRHKSESRAPRQQVLQQPNRIVPEQILGPFPQAPHLHRNLGRIACNLHVGLVRIVRVHQQRPNRQLLVRRRLLWSHLPLPPRGAIDRNQLHVLCPIRLNLELIRILLRAQHDPHPLRHLQRCRLRPHWHRSANIFVSMHHYTHRRRIRQRHLRRQVVLNLPSLQLLLPLLNCQTLGILIRTDICGWLPVRVGRSSSGHSSGPGRSSRNPPRSLRRRRLCGFIRRRL